MASKALLACRVAGCGNVCVGGYCPDHKRVEREAAQRYDAQRGSAASRGYGTKWQAARLEFLSENPICVDPAGRHVGRVEPAYQVDHITPHKGDLKLFWNRKNWQALCQACGAHKSATESGGRAEQRGNAQSMGGSIDANGRITMPAHTNRATKR